MRGREGQREWEGEICNYEVRGGEKKRERKREKNIGTGREGKGE